jgi:peptide/nickel transport system ATP-binding protein
MEPLLEVRHLKKYFYGPAGVNHAVDDISFKIEKGKTMGIVGESGCGKSTLGRTIIRLQDATDGQVILSGKDVTAAKGQELKKLRENMQIIFQDPYSSLDPRMTVEETIKEPLILSRRYKNKKEIDDATTELMHLVGIDERLRLAYPHEMDGGRRQRVGIARALALNPEFVVCDEPVSALDVSIQAQVLNLLMDLQDSRKLTYIFITHNLSVVRHISDDISVMYLGQLVETSPSKELFKHPLHPYTKALLSAIPSTDVHHPNKRILLKGEITSAINPKPGCRFAARCPFATEACQQPQKLEEVLPNHFVSCCQIHKINSDL